MTSEKIIPLSDEYRLVVTEDLPEEVMALDIVERKTVASDGNVVWQFDPHATLDHALEEMHQYLAPPDRETLDFVFNV